MLKIDGNYGEGGGQIIRTALALSTITGKAFEAKDIRKGREEPGLKAQHLFCIKALQELCNAKVEGAFLGSEYLMFVPGEIKGQTISINIGTAGSISLLLQSLLLPCFFSKEKVRLKITGGTAGKWAMPTEFLQLMLIPQIRRFCSEIKMTVERRGYYPSGGGKIDLLIKPLLDKSLAKPFELVEQGTLMHIKGISHASKELCHAEVAERQARTAKSILSKLNVPINIQAEYADTECAGSGITLAAYFSKDGKEIDAQQPIILGADALGEKSKRAEEVGKEAADKMLKEIESRAAVDSHSADNLIPFLAMFGGRIKVSEITEHTKTNIWTCEQFLEKKFEVDENEKIIKVS
jgi:RNA 3'-phosphate cyclase